MTNAFARTIVEQQIKQQETILRTRRVQHLKEKPVDLFREKE
jgi:hypothetical protein